MVSLKRMRTLILCVAILAPFADGQSPKRIALVGGMLLTGYELPPIHHAAVLIEGNRIVQAGPAAEVKIPPDATIIDTRGRTMMPGMIELHAHLLVVGHGDYPRWFKWLDDHKTQYPVERVMEISARQLLMAGVTSAIDLGAPLKESISVRDRIQRNEIPGPRMSVAGPWIIPRAAIFPNSSVEVNGPEQAAAAAEANIAAGVDVIKIQGGLHFPEYKAIVDTAHKHNVKVHVHINEEADIWDAYKAGIDVLHHVGSGSSPPYSDALIRAIVESGRAVVPTAGRSGIYPVTVAFPERLEDPDIAAGFPPDMWAEVQDSFKNFYSLNYFQAGIERADRFREASLKQWINSGALLGIGTDNGVPMTFHADALWRLAKLYADFGMPPSRVIATLTRINARILGKSNQLGTIEPGKLADIIVVKGNPLFDVIALANPEVVIKDGIVFKR
jgi:imidazolonepropionase-like amidohydrolase